MPDEIPVLQLVLNPAIRTAFPFLAKRAIIVLIMVLRVYCILMVLIFHRMINGLMVSKWKRGPFLIQRTVMISARPYPFQQDTIMRRQSTLQALNGVMMIVMSMGNVLH